MKNFVNRGASVLSLALMLASSAVTVAVADVVTINPAKDNSLYEQDAAASNGAGEFLYSGETNFALSRRALLAFDIAGNVPAGATINSATLTLHVSQSAPNGTPSTFSLHALLADWGEGASNAGSPGGLGAPATPGDATWTDRIFPATPWTTAGGDFNGAPSGGSIVASVGSYAWSGAGLVADVQSWLDGPASNFGWILIGPETTGGQARQFDSRENVTPALRPALEIVYTPENGGGPEGVPTVSEWGLIFMILLFLSAGTVMFGRTRPATMRSGNVALMMSPTPPLIDASALLRALTLVFGLLLIGFAAAAVGAGMPSGVDVVGSLVCAPVLAFLLHLWFGFRRR